MYKCFYASVVLDFRLFDVASFIANHEQLQG